MTVMLTGTSPNAELYSRALSNAYRWYYRLIDPDWSIEQDPEIWIKKAWRDPVLAQAMQTRMHMVAGREWQIQPGRKNPSPDDTRAADVVADAFARIAKFSEARALLATSVLRGSSYAFTEGTRETVTLAGLRGKWWTPRKLRNISKQRFIYTPETITHEDGRQTVEVQTRFYPLMDPWPVVVPPEFAERLIKVIYLDEEDRLTGIGGRPLLESVYFLFWAKSEVMKTGLQTLEKWAGGMLIAKTDLHANPGELGRDSDSVKNEMLSMLESMRGRHVAVIDKEDEIEHIDGGQGGGGAAFLEFLRYMDEKIVGLLLGSVLPFGQSGDSAGSYARAVEERAVSDLILDFDKQNVSEAISDTVIRLFWKNNRPQLAAAGLADAAMPQFSILPERRDDFAANAQILSQAINSNMPIKASEAYEKLGLTQPTQEDIDAGDVIEKEEPAGGGFPFRESPGAKFGDPRPHRFAEDVAIGKSRISIKRESPDSKTYHLNKTPFRIEQFTDEDGIDSFEIVEVGSKGPGGVYSRIVHIGEIANPDQMPHSLEDALVMGYKVANSEGYEAIGVDATDSYGEREESHGPHHPPLHGEPGASTTESRKGKAPPKTREESAAQIKSKGGWTSEGWKPAEKIRGGFTPDEWKEYQEKKEDEASTSRKRCPDGSRKDEDSGACEKFAEGDPFAELRLEYPDPVAGKTVDEWIDLTRQSFDDPNLSDADLADFVRRDLDEMAEEGAAEDALESEIDADIERDKERGVHHDAIQEAVLGRLEEAGIDVRPDVYTSTDETSRYIAITEPGGDSWLDEIRISDHEQVKGGGLNPETQQRMGKSGISIVVDENGEADLSGLDDFIDSHLEEHAEEYATADKPSGKRKRCPDGEHKDEDGSCRPVT